MFVPKTTNIRYTCAQNLLLRYNVISLQNKNNFKHVSNIWLDLLLQIFVKEKWSVLDATRTCSSVWFFCEFWGL